MHVTIFSTGGEFRLVSNFPELHTVTQATRSHALLICHMHHLHMQHVGPANIRGCRPTEQKDFVLP